MAPKDTPQLAEHHVFIVKKIWIFNLYVNLLRSIKILYYVYTSILVLDPPTANTLYMNY